MKVLGEELSEKQLAILVAAFGVGILATLAFQKRTELAENIRRVIEKS